MLPYFVNAVGCTAPLLPSSCCPFCGMEAKIADDFFGSVYACGYVASGAILAACRLTPVGCITPWPELKAVEETMSEETMSEVIITTDSTDSTEDFIEDFIDLTTYVPTHDEITATAAALWYEMGQPIGQDEIIWQLAEEEVRTLKKKKKKSVKSAKSSAMTIKKPSPTKDKFSCWELTELAVGKCNRVLLWGVSGTGKSWAARKNNLNGHKVYSVSLTDETPAAELRGHYGLVEGSYKWLDGPCVMAWRNGARLVLNELEKASGDAQTFLLGLLDDPEIAQQTLPNGETIYPAKGFHVVATMNGKPDEDLYPALRDRFPTCIHIDSVAPPALKALPPEIRHIATSSGVIDEAQRRISIRVWNEFMWLREEIGPHAAAACVFGNRAKTVLEHLKIAPK